MEPWTAWLVVGAIVLVYVLRADRADPWVVVALAVIGYTWLAGGLVALVLVAMLLWFAHRTMGGDIVNTVIRTRGAQRSGGGRKKSKARSKPFSARLKAYLAENGN